MYQNINFKLFLEANESASKSSSRIRNQIYLKHIELIDGQDQYK